MKPLTSHRASRLALSDLLSGALSAAVLLRRGHVENGHASAPVNAIAHWIWPRQALRQDLPSARFTLTGLGIHFAASMLWCGLYEALRSRRAAVTVPQAVGDAVAVAAVAAVVDLACVPERFTPGFERRLQPTSLLLVYGAFAAGLALAGVAALKKP